MLSLKSAVAKRHIDMQGKSHVGFAITGSITINSGLYASFPHSLPGVAEDILHTIGEPFTYGQIASLWHNLFDPSLFAILWHKLSLYILLIMCARLPDRLERRRLDSATGIPVSIGVLRIVAFCSFYCFFSLWRCRFLWEITPNNIIS
jgi:hypothetical protein